jgi:hypothetical protein
MSEQDNNKIQQDADVEGHVFYVDGPDTDEDVEGHQADDGPDDEDTEGHVFMVQPPRDASTEGSPF